MKQIILFRGLPGSGKSSLAESLCKIVYSADMFFEQDGNYNFDPTKLPDAHKWCKGKVEDAMVAEIENVVSSDQNSFTMAIGILKSSDRMEWIVEKCTEIGVGKLIFFKSQNSERTKVNIDKLRKTAIAALKQSHGSWLPVIEESTFEKVIQLNSEHKYLAFCDEAMISNKPIPFEKDSIVFIGPEGDFTLSEVEQAIENGIKVIGLGKQILRSETAALVCASWSIG
jgi:16S rRNA (uracil1498-N3)-methyltransferase